MALGQPERESATSHRRYEDAYPRKGDSLARHIEINLEGPDRVRLRVVIDPVYSFTDLEVGLRMVE